MTRRTLFAALLAPFAPKPKLPSLTCVGPSGFADIRILARYWMLKDLAPWQAAARKDEALKQLGTTLRLCAGSWNDVFDKALHDG